MASVASIVLVFTINWTNATTSTILIFPSLFKSTHDNSSVFPDIIAYTSCTTSIIFISWSWFTSPLRQFSVTLTSIGNDV